MNKPIKKIIAREGLVLVGTVLTGVLINGIAWLLHYLLVAQRSTPDGFIPDEPIIITVIAISGLIVGVFGYPIYLLIRFILWAVRTLKEEL